MQRLLALFILAWGLIRSLLAPVFGFRRGLADFRKSYEKERLLPVAPDERETFPSLGGCIACGLCDQGLGSLIAGSRGQFSGVMNLMTASSRSMPDFDAAARSLSFVTDAQLAELEPRCPTRVPMRKVASLIRAKANAGA